MNTVGSWCWNPAFQTFELSRDFAIMCGLPDACSLTAAGLGRLFGSMAGSDLLNALQQSLQHNCPVNLRLATETGIRLHLLAAPPAAAEILQGLATRIDAPESAGPASNGTAAASGSAAMLAGLLGAGLLEIGPQLELISCNPLAEQWLQYANHTDWPAFLAGPGGAAVRTLLTDCLAGRPGAPLFQAIDRHGQHQYLQIRALPAASAETGSAACWLILEDISELAHLKHQLSSVEQRWLLALESSGDGVWDWHPQTGVEYLSDRLKAIYGYTPDDIGDVADELDRRTHPDDIGQMLADRQAHFDGLTPSYINEHRVLCKDGRWKWILTRGIVIERDAAGTVTRMVGTHTDISEKRAAETALKESEERLRMALSATHQGLYDLDLRSGQAIVDEEYANMLGYAHCDFVESSENWKLRVHPDDFQASENAFFDYLNGKADEYRVEFRQKHADGGWVWVLSVGAMVEWDEAGNPVRMLGTVLNITEKKHSEALIWQQANIDPLTGLPNRRMFYDRLALDLRRSKRNHTRLAVLFIDLDFFKEVNDTLGHATGDALLSQAAKRLQNCVREADIVARLGGDEFTIALTDLSPQAGREPVEQIASHIIHQLTQPYLIGQEEIYLSASAGITFYPDDGDNLEDLVKHADQAMYAAKNGGRNRFAYFTPAMQTAALARLRLGNELRTAINELHLQVYFQPIIDLSNGQIKKAEALIRWQHEQLGWISPAEFIPIAESSGLISQIGDMVFRSSAHWCRHWRHSSQANFQIAINQSPLEFQSDKNRYRNWTAYLHELNLPGQALVIEITEGLLLDAHNTVTEQLLTFRDAGIQVAIDDFGTGYSSLSYLKKFDIDYLKIDRSFIHNLGTEASDLALCEAIIMMAHKLGLKVIAEGVENEQQLRLLRSVNCDYAQGFLFAKPLPPEQFDQLLRDYSGLAPDLLQ